MIFALRRICSGYPFLHLVFCRTRPFGARYARVVQIGLLRAAQSSVSLVVIEQGLPAPDRAEHVLGRAPVMRLSGGQL